MTDEPDTAVRPLLGHDDVVARLDGAWRGGRMHHALLLVGPRGIGKATLAGRLAAAVASVQPDLVAAVRDGALSRTGNAVGGVRTLELAESAEGRLKKAIGVDQVRGLSAFLRQRRPGGGWRVVVIDAVDDLNAQAANALLKILEEPGERTLFILVSHGSRGVLPTIRSRCQTMRVAPLSPDRLRAGVAAAGEGEPADAVLAAAGGSVGRALELMREAEIVEAVPRILAASDWPASAVARVLDAASARGGEDAFAIASGALTTALSDEARTRARANAPAAARPAEAALRLANDVAEREAYGVDRRTNLRNAFLDARRALGLDDARPASRVGANALAP